MGIVIRQSIKGTVISYLGIVLGAITYIYLFPRYLDPESLGLFRFIQDMAIVLAVLFQGSAPSMLIRFFPRFSKLKGINSYVNFILIYPLPLIITLSVIYILLKDILVSIYQEKSPELIPYFTHILILTIVIVYLNIVDAISRINLRIVVPNFFREVGVRMLIIGLVIGFYYYSLTVNLLIIFLLAIYLFTLSVNLIYIKRLEFLKFTPPSFPKGPFRKEFYTYGLIAVIGSISYVIISKIDIMMIGSYLGLAEVGIFSVSFFMASVIDVPRKAVSQISSGIISNYWSSNDKKSLNELYQKASQNLFLFGGFIYLMILANLKFIYSIMPNGAIYEQGYWVFFLIGLSKLFDMASGPNTEIIAYSPYYRMNLLLSSLLSVLLIAFNIFLIPRFGIVGAALGTMTAVILFNISKFTYLLRIHGLQPFTGKTFITLFLLSLCICVNYLISTGNVFWDAALKSFSILLLFLFFVSFFHLSIEGEALIKRIRQAVKSLLSP